MSNWIKNNNKWVKSNNDIGLNIFKSNDIGNIENINHNNAIVYIPTHNINDVYEWYRIFNDSYSFTDNVDKYGFAIHTYFSKERGQSIVGWFPNLIEVKASSSDILQYYDDTNNYYRSSIDNVLNFNQSNLFIDNVEILDGEKVLLRHQYNEQLSLFSINTTLSNNNNYYIPIVSGDEKYFNIGDEIIFKTSDNQFIKDTIILHNITQINAIDYIVVKTNTTISNVTDCGSITNGLWTKNSQEYLNGVYEYNNEQLVVIPEMFDKYKTFNQIIYVYQGETNINKEFYLRRNEDKTSLNYTLYPIHGLSEPLIYSKGSAYLIKCKLDYSLNIDSTSLTNMQTLASCCSCIANINTNVPDHPTTLPPYDIDTDPFRLLMLDNTVADKVFSTNENGIGTYNVNTPMIIDDCDNDIEFTLTDIDLNNNILNTYNATEYYNIATTPIYNFNYITLGLNEVLTVNFTEDNTITLSNVGNSTQFAMTYDGIDYLSVDATAGLVGHFIHMKLDFTINGETYTALDQEFIIRVVTVKNTTNFTVQVYPQLDINVINDLNNKISLGNEVGNSIKFDVSYINTWGTKTGSSVDERTNVLIEHLNKSIIGKIYDLSTSVDLSNQVTLNFNGIRRNTRYKWENLGIGINYLSNNYFIEHSINKNYRPYFYNYTINKYLTEYLNCDKLELTQFGEVIVSYLNLANNDNRFGIEGSNKLAGKGNIIYFGSNYKDLILDNIKKNMLIEIYNQTSTITNSDVWIDSVIWDDVNNVGKITTLNYINNGLPNDIIKLTPYTNIEIISDKLKTILDKQLNTIDNVDFAQFPVYKPDTATYAYAMMNKTINSSTSTEFPTNMSLYNNVTGVLYKDFNEPRISFLKRDRTFQFDNDPRIVVNSATENPVDLTQIASTILSIDSIPLQVGHLTLIKNQVDPTENGVYIVTSMSSLLIRYEPFNKSIFWVVEDGNVNIDLSYQAYYELPLNIGTSEITFLDKYYRTKKDNRLTLKPIEIAKLGVDNKTNSWVKINKKYDTQELQENLLNIQVGINNINKIRFIDGLTENNILNDIAGQGQHIWILGENVITENAIVGCTQEFGPGTGDLIWYSGTWVNGTWCNGIWIQGTWKEGTWVNGVWNAYPIQDLFYYVPYTTNTNNLLSKWESGTWINGIFNGGIIDDITWLNGTFNFGIINDGLWEDGTFNNGIIKHVIWNTGNFYGGDFETGLWKSGILNELDPTIPARFGIGSDTTTGLYSDRAIWIKGIFNSGQFHSGNNTQHNGSIFYSGTFIDADFYGGSFISGDFQNSVWYNGVYFGGYNVTIADDIGTNKLITINPAQYDLILGLTTLFGYIPNTTHNAQTHTSSFYMLGTPTVDTSFTDVAFVNQWDEIYTTTYPTKSYIVGSVTDTTLKLDISSDSVGSTVYVASNTSTNTPSGNPLLCSGFVGIFKGGIWLNGYFKSGTFETGSWINGYASDIVIGII